MPILTSTEAQERFEAVVRDLRGLFVTVVEMPPQTPPEGTLGDFTWKRTLKL